MKTYTLMLPVMLLSGWLLPMAGPAQADTEPRSDATTVSLSGRLNVLWGDPPQGSGLPPTRAILLFDDSGSATGLLMDEELLEAHGGLLALNGKQVTVNGERADLPEGQVWVDSIALAEGEGLDIPDTVAGGPTGSQPWVTILCRFSDSTGTTPETRAWFQTLMGNADPGMDHYWRQLSYDNINLNGSTVVGWYNLPNPRSYYVYDSDDDGDLDLNFGRAAVACTAAANADVYFPDFMGINMIFNEDLDCCAWGGSTILNIDGQTRGYSATWMPPWGFRKHSTMGQEMGHGFGLPHSSGPYAATYDSQWDVMSSGGMCSNPHVEYTCLGVHTIAYHKNMLGWIPGARRFTRYSDDLFARIMTIERLAFPPANNNFLMAELITEWFMLLGARIPTQWYTIESRRRVGYDVEIPGEAVVIHEVTHFREDRAAQVVDPDGDGDPNDAGAMWLPGENFYDAAKGVQIFIESETSTGYVVSITNSPRGTTYVSRTNAGTENGSSGNPWNTVSEGFAGVIPGGTIYTVPGSYSETMMIRKPLVFRRWGSSGSVTIGD